MQLFCSQKRAPPGEAAAASAGGGSTAAQPRFIGLTAPLPSSTGLNRGKPLCEVPDPNEHAAGGLRPRLYWAAARGRQRPAENRAHCACRRPTPSLGRWARSASYAFRAPRWACPCRVPPASVLGCVRCGGWLIRTRLLTRPVSCAVRCSTGDSAGAPGLFSVDADTCTCGSENATPGSCVCVRVLVLPGRVGRAGLPGAFWCASPFPLAALSFSIARPLPGLGCPFPVPLFASFFCCVFPFVRLCCLLLSLVSGPGCLGPWRFVFLSTPPFPLFWSVVRPRCLWLSLVSGPGHPGLGAVCCLFCWSVASRCPCVSCLAVGCSLVAAAPPPPPPTLLCLPVFVAAAPCPFSFFLFVFFLPALLPPAGSALVGGSRHLPPPPPSLVCFAGLRLLGSLCALAAFVFPARLLAAPSWLPPPPYPPFCVSRFSSLPRGALFSFLCCFALACLLGARRRFLPSAAPPPLLLFVLLVSRCSVCSRCSSGSRLAVCSSLVVASPPLLCLAVLVAAARCSVFFSPPLLRCSHLLGSRLLLPPPPPPR